MILVQVHDHFAENLLNPRKPQP